MGNFDYDLFVIGAGSGGVRAARMAAGFGALLVLSAERLGDWDDDEEELEAARHRGGAWPWLMGAFVEAWVRLRGNTLEVRRQGRERSKPRVRTRRPAVV